MCLHSPYAESWHLYTFPKLLSISKKINFCLGLLCKLELLFGCCRELLRGTFFSQPRFLSVLVAGETKAGCAQCPRTEAWTISRQRRKWFLLRETNCFPGQQAVALDSLPSACFSVREKAACLFVWHPSPWQEGCPRTGTHSFLTCATSSLPLLSLWPVILSTPALRS